MAALTLAAALLFNGFLPNQGGRQAEGDVPATMPPPADMPSPQAANPAPNPATRQASTTTMEDNPPGGLQKPASTVPAAPSPDGRQAPDGATIIVFGIGVYDNGSIYDIAKPRVEKAAEVYRSGRAGRILFAGGWACSQARKPPVTEAEAMGRYAVSLGVDPKAVLIVDQSRNNIGSAYLARRYFDAHSLPKGIILVTSDFHMERAKYLIDKFFGPQYHIEAEAAGSGLSAAESQSRRISEQNSLNSAKASLDTIKDGDYAALDGLMRKNPGLICS
jgi:uncharacterized SAM-binding protein YcdF (DUF218 family)